MKRNSFVYVFKIVQVNIKFYVREPLTNRKGLDCLFLSERKIHFIQTNLYYERNITVWDYFLDMRLLFYNNTT